MALLLRTFRSKEKDDYKSQEKIKTMLTHNFGATKKEYYGIFDRRALLISNIKYNKTSTLRALSNRTQETVL